MSLYEVVFVLIVLVVNSMPKINGVQMPMIVIDSMISNTVMPFFLLCFDTMADMLIKMIRFSLETIGDY